MPEPITIIGGSAVAAYISKDGLNKLLGPTAEYLGESLKELVKKRSENVGKIFSNAEKKLGDKIDNHGKVSPKVLRRIIDDASFCDDEVSLDYFGGILASSRTSVGRDDRGARVAKILEGMSSYQIRSHYLIYSYIKKIFKKSGYFYNLDDRPKMEIFIPFSSYYSSMDFNEEEMSQITSIINHSFFGLSNENLIDSFRYGSKDNLQSYSTKINDNGIVVSPSAFGAELYLWGYGMGSKDLDFALNDNELKDIDSIKLDLSGIIPTKED